MIELFNEKKNCCGCAACMNICPKQAITMKGDIDGFSYPEINNDLCIVCGLCKKVCAFQNIPSDDKEPIATYVAINKNKEVLSASASGGIFGALASLVLEKDGVVFGCAYNDDMETEHICINNTVDVKKIQGSKYVQSNINTTYAEAKKYLEVGKWVLFTGSPCQIAGLKSYLGKNYTNLITADIICHGVPSVDFFKGYIRSMEDSLMGKIIDFRFRDKSKGWGLMSKVVYKKNGKVLERFVHSNTSYYYSYFLEGDIYRENCYECKYACGNREGDFTMGDYWGIEKAHPNIETERGVSVLLVNSKKGMMLINELTRYLDLTISTFQQARRQNSQLNRPTTKSDRREIILKTWREGGYKAVSREYYKACKWTIMVSRLKMLVPQSVKRIIKKLSRSIT